MMVALALLASCGTGPQAPLAVAGDLVCNAGYCVMAPTGWDVIENGEDFTRFAHGATPEAMATVAPVNMEAVMVQSGGSWPAPAESVVRAFWELLDAAGSASFGSLEFAADGSVSSRGSYESGRLWYRLIPLTGSRGLGIEVRGPNSSWQSHADVFLGSLAVVP